jgi:phage tail sheath protein FI
VGNIPSKIERALVLAENIQTQDIDIAIGPGLETVWAYTAGTLGVATFDDTADVASAIASLGHPDTGTSSLYAGYHKTVFNLYNNFCQQTRKDCIHISDAIRGIFVQGSNSKTLSNKSKNFTQHVYNPIKNLYAASNSNYAATYANWISVYDNNSGKFIWLPFAGWQAAIKARVDANLFPWSAAMGLNNGIIRNITDIAVKPNQKQQDALYRIGVNPIVFFQGDGYTVWGQKTLQAKPSAFDRINVRRLFLTLERATLKVMRYFVGEPNTVFTRSRVGNILKPIFDLAKNNEGCYDYLIVCDERNNTANVIDNNEMKVDIYIKPVRTAEFILVTFVATRTDQDFNELVG